MLEWQKVKLGDVTDFLTGYPFKSAHYTVDESGIRLVRGDNIVQGRLRWEGVKRWPIDRIAEHEAYFLRPNDVVLAMDRPWIEAGLKYSQIREADCPALLVQRVTRLRETESIDGRFLAYVIGCREFTAYVLAIQTGTAVPHISGGQIRAYEFHLPSVAEQRAIASVLAALDDKIELNRRMNETLEASAQALFRDWFVDFGPTRAKMAGATPYLAPDIWSLFPSAFDNEGKPEGWVQFRLEELAEYRTGVINPALHPDILFEHYSLPAYDSGQQPALDLGSNIKSNKTQIPSGAILLSKLNPETPRVWIPDNSVGRPKVASTEFLAFVPKKHVGMSLIYSLFNATPFRQTLAGMVTGTSKSHQRVSPRAVAMLSVLTADAALFGSFEQLAAPMLDRILANRLQSRTLAETRDQLLPKLMSGEIRVEQAEQLVGDKL